MACPVSLHYQAHSETNNLYLFSSITSFVYNLKLTEKLSSIVQIKFFFLKHLEVAKLMPCNPRNVYVFPTNKTVPQNYNTTTETGKLTMIHYHHLLFRPHSSSSVGPIMLLTKASAHAKKQNYEVHFVLMTL